MIVVFPLHTHLFFDIFYWKNLRPRFCCRLNNSNCINVFQPIKQIISSPLYYKFNHLIHFFSLVRILGSVV